MDKIHAVVLAAGKSSRFQGPTSKLLTKLGSQEMLLYSLQLLEQLNFAKTYVLGHQKELLEELLYKNAKNPINFVLQTEQLGTGHALACSRASWHSENVLVLNGDMPLVKPQLINDLIQVHQQQQAVVSFVAFHASNPTGYGRVIINDQHLKIVEQKDANTAELACSLVNAGIYLFKTSFLQASIDQLDQHNAAQEFYLTDLIAIADKQQLPIAIIEGPEAQLLGINTTDELFCAEQLLSYSEQNLSL